MSVSKAFVSPGVEQAEMDKTLLTEMELADTTWMRGWAIYRVDRLLRHTIATGDVGPRRRQGCP